MGYRLTHLTDINQLEKVARLRLIEDRIAPTALNIHRMVTKMQADEVEYLERYGVGSYVLENTALDIPGGCTE